MYALFTLSVLLSAALLFWVEPMVARMILPAFGGSPAVWNTSLLFFQAVLLAGYLYAHVVGSRLQARAQVLVQAAVLGIAALGLPIALRVGWAPTAGRAPVLDVLFVLTSLVALPFFALSTSGPLLQRWFSRTRHPRARQPWFLYAASNAGSVLGLLAYPLLVEPWLTLGAQSRWWAFGYGLAALGLVASGIVALRDLAPDAPAEPMALPSAAPSWADRLKWLLLAGIPSSLTLGVTTCITTDIASFPLLWVIPLTLYLGTLIVAFSGASRLATRGSVALLPLAAIAAVVAFQVPTDRFLMPLVFAQLAIFVVAAMACHGVLASRRPDASHLTAFYLWVALGGALGGAFNAIVAPLIFDDTWEYPLAIALACLAALPLAQRGRISQRVRWGVASVLAAAVMLAFLPAWREKGEVFEKGRSFFGHYEILGVADGSWRELRHGTTFHGIQGSGIYESIPTTYFHPTGPIGRVFTLLNDDPRLDRVAVVGLGIGTLAAYAKPGRTMVFIEIDPAILKVALDTRYFTFLRQGATRRDGDLRSDIRFVVGDGRVAMAGMEDASFGLVVIDAFSSDAIPVHLATREALALYLRKLRPDGILAFHITNRHVDLRPVLAAGAESLGLSAWSFFDVIPSHVDEGKQPSEWVLMARETRFLSPVIEEPDPETGAPRWTPLSQVQGRVSWTDDHADILSVVNLGGG